MTRPLLWYLAELTRLGFAASFVWAVAKLTGFLG